VEKVCVEKVYVEKYVWSGHSCPLPLTLLLPFTSFVIPTGAGAPARAEWRNLAVGYFGGGLRAHHAERVANRPSNSHTVSVSVIVVSPM